MSKVARGALYGQVQRETGKWHDELRHSSLTFIRGAKPDPSEAGHRRQRRKRADAKLREVAEAPSAELDVLSDRWSDYNASESLGVDTMTFDADGAHVDGCDLPRCPECAETIGLDPWWVEQRRADDAAIGEKQR